MSIKRCIDSSGRLSLRDLEFVGYSPGVEVEVIRTITNTLIIVISNDVPPPPPIDVRFRVRPNRLELPEP